MVVILKNLSNFWALCVGRLNKAKIPYKLIRSRNGKTTDFGFVFNYAHPLTKSQSTFAIQLP